MIHHPNLVGCWMFEGNASGYIGPNFTVHGADTYTPEAFGQAKTFAENGRLQLSEKFTPAGPKTIEFRIRTHAAFSSGVGILYANSHNSAKHGVRVIMLSDGRLQWTHAKGTSGTLNFAATTTLSTETAYHIACTWTGTTASDGAKLYVNGVLTATATALSGTDNQTYNLMVGGHQNNNLYARCDLDELRVWDVVLSPNDINRSMLYLQPLEV